MHKGGYKLEKEVVDPKALPDAIKDAVLLPPDDSWTAIQKLYDLMCRKLSDQKQGLLIRLLPESVWKALLNRTRVVTQQDRLTEGKVI